MSRAHPSKYVLLEGVTSEDSGGVVPKFAFLDETTNPDRPAIIAYNEGGYAWTRVDLRELLAWVRKNRPELWPKNGA